VSSAPPLVLAITKLTASVATEIPPRLTIEEVRALLEAIELRENKDE
jgi:hypothetical protein